MKLSQNTCSLIAQQRIRGRCWNLLSETIQLFWTLVTWENNCQKLVAAQDVLSPPSLFCDSFCKLFFSAAALELIIWFQLRTNHKFPSIEGRSRYIQTLWQRYWKGKSDLHMGMSPKGRMGFFLKPWDFSLLSTGSFPFSSSSLFTAPLFFLLILFHDVFSICPLSPLPPPPPPPPPLLTPPLSHLTVHLLPSFHICAIKTPKLLILKR